MPVISDLWTSASYPTTTMVECLIAGVRVTFAVREGRAINPGTFMAKN